MFRAATALTLLVVLPFVVLAVTPSFNAAVAKWSNPPLFSDLSALVWAALWA
jgi:hypothetical protein